MRVLRCLFLLQLLLLLVVFLFDLLELLLLLLLDLLLLLLKLLLPGSIRILLLELLLLLLLLLILLLLHLLVFLILFLLQLLDLFLMLLFDLRVHVVGRVRSGRTVPIGVGIRIGIRVRVGVGIWIDVSIWIHVGVRRPVVVYRSVHVRVGVRIDVRVWIHVGVRRPIVVHRGVNVWIVVYRRVHIRIDVGARRAIVVLLHAPVPWLRISLLLISGPRISRLHVSRLRTRSHSGRRRHPHRHYVVVWLLGLQLADLGIRNGLPFVGLDGCLTLRKRQRSGRRRRLCDDRTRLDRSGRLIAHGGAATKNSLPRRHDGGSCNGYLRCGHFPLINPNHVAPNGLSGAEGLAGSRGDPACDTLVHIRYVGNVFVDDGGVVIVVDHGLVHRRIGNVYVVDVDAARMIGRHIDWTHIGDGDSARRARYPSPTAANIHPAAIVERSKAPGRVIHPRPTPRRNPCPVAVAIRRPSNHGNVREPDRAVFRNLAPAAVIVEVFIADHVIGNVAARDCVFFAVIALAAPAIEIVVTIRALHVCIQRISSGENALVTGMNRVGRAAAGHFARAFGHIDNSCVAGFIDVDAIAAGTQDGKRKIGCVHFNGFLVFEAKDAEIDGAFGDTDLHHPVVEIQERKSGLARQADHRGTHMELGARALIGPEFVAGGHGAVHSRGHPIIGAAGTERNFSVGVAQAGYTAWWIITVVLGHSWFCGRQNKNKD